MMKSVVTTRDRVLELLRAGGCLSGEQISKTMQLSRTAVWKQIKTLRAMGFSIEAHHARGYELIDGPDLVGTEVQRDLDVEILGRFLDILPQVDSTNILMKKRAEEGAPEGTAIVADMQLTGKGRLGRNWHSPAGVNLYLSVLLRPDIPIQTAPQLTFLSAVAVAETLKDICGVAATVKWPNDVLVGGAKIAGLLNEMDAETERVNFVVLGIGVNLNMTRDLFPAELNYPATSAFLETDNNVNRGVFLKALLERLDCYYREFQLQGFAPIRQRWEHLCPIVGQRVVVDGGRERMTGRVVGLESDGALQLELDSGQMERIVAGDVRVVD